MKEYAALLNDDDEVVGMSVSSNGSVLFRIDGEWGHPTWEQIEELDGLSAITIDESFTSVFDDAQASGKTLTESAVQDYVTETSQ